MARSVTLVAGQNNVELPNGLFYNSKAAKGGITISAVSDSGTVVTFTAANTLSAGDEVTIAGLGTTGFQSLNGTVVTVISAGLSTSSFSVTSALTGTTTTGTASADGPTIYLSDDEGAKLNPNVFTDGVLIDNGVVVGPVRKVTIVAGNYNVELPNGISYNATHPTSTNGPVVYLTVAEGAALVVNSAVVDGGWITSGS